MLKQHLLSIFKDHLCVTLIFFICFASSGIMTGIGFSKTVTSFQSYIIPDSFNSIENENTRYIQNIPVITRNISSIRFGCNDSDYFKSDYRKVHIVTPKIDLSQYFELSMSSQDYYKLHSNRIPLNGRITFPSDILEINNQHVLLILN